MIPVFDLLLRSVVYSENNPFLLMDKFKTFGLKQGKMLNQNATITCDSTHVRADSSLKVNVNQVESNIRSEFNKLNERFSILYTS